MNTVRFTILLTLATMSFAVYHINYANAQTPPPPLESKPPAATETPTSPPTPALGKITIQISQTEQIVIDLPLKNDAKYSVIPIK